MITGDESTFDRHESHLGGLHPHKGIGLLEIVADLAVQYGLFDIFLPVLLSLVFSYSAVYSVSTIVANIPK